MPTSNNAITKFSLDIEELVWEKDISYIEAIVLYCEQNGYEVELIAKLISGSLKSKVQLEAESLNFLPKSETNKLPV